MAKLVSKTYGEALFKLAMEENTLDQVAEEAKVVLEVFQNDEEVTRLLNHPKISKEEKVKIIEKIFKGKFSDSIVGFLVLIVEKGRYNEIEHIFQYFLGEVMEYKNIGIANVTSAFPLSESQKKEIEDRLLQTTKYVEFVMNYDVNPELIGGVVIRIGDRVVDGSIRSKIAGMTKQLNNIQLS